MDISTVDRVLVKQLPLQEREALRAHLLRLSAADRRSRFASSANDALINRYVDSLNWAWQHYLVLGAFVDGELRGAGECCIADGVSAEFAFSVEPPLQRQGIGSALFRRLVEVARARRIEEARITTEAGNVAMRAMARRHGMRLQGNREIVGRLDLRRRPVSYYSRLTPPRPYRLGADEAPWVGR